MDAMRRVGVSERRSCAQVDIGRGTYRYQGRSATDEPVVRGLIRELARLRPRFGSPRLSALVRRELGPVNHQRVERIYAQEGRQLPRRQLPPPGRRTGGPFGGADWTEPALVDGFFAGQHGGWKENPGLDHRGPVHPGVSGD